MREAEICDNLRKQKRVGRPPKFVSPKPKRRRLGVPAVEDVDDDDDDEEEEEEEDPVEDAGVCVCVWLQTSCAALARGRRQNSARGAVR